MIAQQEYEKCPRKIEQCSGYCPMEMANLSKTPCSQGIMAGHPQNTAVVIRQENRSGMGWGGGDDEYNVTPLMSEVIESSFLLWALWISLCPSERTRDIGTRHPINVGRSKKRGYARCFEILESISPFACAGHIYSTSLLCQSTLVFVHASSSKWLRYYLFTVWNPA